MAHSAFDLLLMQWSRLHSTLLALLLISGAQHERLCRVHTQHRHLGAHEQSHEELAGEAPNDALKLATVILKDFSHLLIRFSDCTCKLLSCLSLVELTIFLDLHCQSDFLIGPAGLEPAGYIAKITAFDPLGQ